MDEAKLSKLREDLKNARRKRDNWEAKVKDLEQRYTEAENTCIHGLMQEVNLTYEELAQLMRNAKTGTLFAAGEDSTEEAGESQEEEPAREEDEVWSE